MECVVVNEIVLGFSVSYVQNWICSLFDQSGKEVSAIPSDMQMKQFHISFFFSCFLTLLHGKMTELIFGTMLLCLIFVLLFVCFSFGEKMADIHGERFQSQNSSLILFISV